jgi:hypothetical protein
MQKGIPGLWEIIEILRKVSQSLYYSVNSVSHTPEHDLGLLFHLRIPEKLIIAIRNETEKCTRS